MLILAGVSLNATIGDNGIITRAQEAKIMQGIAVLEEQINFKKAEKADEMEKMENIAISDFSYNEYPRDGFLTRVSYGAGDTYVFNLEYLDRLSKELKGNLVGGEGVNGSLALVRNVYGINEDFKVWYVDADGKIYGATGIKEVPIDPNEVASASQALKEAMGVTGDLTVGDVRGRSTLTLDGSKMTSSLKNMDELSLFPNLKELTLKNLSLDNIEGLQYSPNIEKIWLDNTKVVDYSGLKFGINVVGFYPINNSVDNSNIVAMTEQFANMPKLDTVRIRNNEELTSIPALKTIGNIKTLWIEENANLTNIYGLSTVNNKTSLINLYLNENNLTDVVNTIEKHESYDYPIPKITDGNVINMSYIDGYSNLTYLNCGTGYEIGVSSGYYENDLKDELKRYNENLKYLSGENNGKIVGVPNLKNLYQISFCGCDILDLEKLKSFQEVDKIVLKTIDLSKNNNLKNAQVNLIAKLLNNASRYDIPGQYLSLLSSQKETLNYAGTGLTDLSFLDENKITKRLNLNYNNGINDSQTVYIKKMTQLVELDLENCKGITDFSFLADLPNLEYLDLMGTKVTNEDIRKLSCKTKLLKLALANCSLLSDISILNDFTNEVYCWGVGEFDLQNWNISENCNLSYFNSKNYTYLGFNKGNLTTCQEAISKCNGRYGLYLWNKEDMLKQLEKCTKITYLKCSSYTDNKSDNYYQGETTLNLSLCKTLGEVYFKRTSIENLNVTGCNSLKKVTIIDMNMGSRWVPTDFSKNIQLNYLDLTKNHLTQNDFVKIINDITPIKDGEELKSGAPNLTNLILSGNEFNSLSPLANLSGKTTNFTLDVSNNILINLNGIEDLTQLTELNISDNPGITNVTPIITLKNKSGSKLNRVVLTGCTGITTEMKENLKNIGITVDG